jgi:hypothetical protein
MAISTLTYHQIERIEVDFEPDASSPVHSRLKLRIYSLGSSQPDRISIFPCSASAADHLHNIFLACQLMLDPPALPEEEVGQEVGQTSCPTSTTGELE